MSLAQLLDRAAVLVGLADIGQVLLIGLLVFAPDLGVVGLSLLERLALEPDARGGLVARLRRGFRQVVRPVLRLRPLGRRLLDAEEVSVSAVFEGGPFSLFEGRGWAGFPVSLSRAL